MQKDKRWDIKTRHTVTTTKMILADLSISVRTDQYNLFKKIIKPKRSWKILDVGVTSDEILKDSNMFEKLYPYQEKLTAATIENAKKIKKLYPKLKSVVTIKAHKKLPFKDKTFDVIVSWATLEHTGNYKDQEFFLNELLRVGKKVFITTPYRGALYEPHSGYLFLHWLPLSFFRKICALTGKKFWSKSEHLNPLWISDIKNMKLSRAIHVKIFKTFNFLPSHIIITG